MHTYANEYEIEEIVAFRICKHNKLKYFIKWKGWEAVHNTWEEESQIHVTAADAIISFWIKTEQKWKADGKSDTLIRDLQGELDCPHFAHEPERLYRKRYADIFANDL